MSELSRLNPKELAQVTQAGIISGIKEHEAKLAMKYHNVYQPEEVEKQAPAKINRFEREETDLVAYQKKIQELQQVEREKQLNSDFNSFRKQLNLTALSRRLPQDRKKEAEEKFYRKLLDQYEPISKERAKDLLHQMDDGIKAVDAKTDEKPFGELFAEYGEKYRDFMADLLKYHQERLSQGMALQEIRGMVDIVRQGKPM